MFTASQNTQGPIFIGGLERSGKTYMRMMLSALPHLFFSRRANMWTYFYGRFGNLAHDKNLERCLSAMMQRKHIRHLEPNLDHIRDEFKRGPRTYGRLFALFHEQAAGRAESSRWGDQTGLIEQYAPAIMAAYPNAKIIHMMRDPRDRFEALCTRDSRQRHRLGKATAQWLYSEALARDNLNAFAAQYIVVRYESMVLQPQETMQAVCKFLNEPYSPALLTMAHEPRFHSEYSTAFPVEESPLSPTYIGRYRKGLSAVETAFIQKYTERHMPTYHYTPLPLALSTAEKARFYLTLWGPNVLQMAAWRIRETRQTRADFGDDKQVEAVKPMATASQVR